MNEPESAIELADKAQRRTFTGYVIVLVLAALVTAAWTAMLWNATNKYQAAVKADADARIAEAAVRIKELENNNLALKNDLMLSQLQLTDPKLKEAEFRRHMSNALSRFAALPSTTGKRVVSVGTPRRKLRKEDIDSLPEKLGVEPKGAVDIMCAADKILEGEPSNLASEIAEALNSVGWSVDNKGESSAIWSVSFLLPA